MSKEKLEQAKRKWEERLANYEYELSITASVENKFELQERIQECQEKIEQISTKELPSDIKEYLKLLSDSSKNWIDLLESSLKYTNNHGKFDLKLQELPNAVKLPRDFDTNIYQNKKLSSKDILKEYKHPRILILGAPGSGKTTILLTLLKNLIEQYNNKSKKTVPVYLHLSSWTDKHKNFTDWLVYQLYQTYQIPNNISKIIYEQRLILLLLDGLDEVNRKYRIDCLKKLNIFIQDNSLVNIVVCSRLKEYQDILECNLLKPEKKNYNESKKLRLNKAFCIQPLKNEEINNFLNLKEKSINHLITLFNKYEEAKTPLVIYAIKKANFQEKDIEKLSSSSLNLFWKNLWKTYIDITLQRKSDTFNDNFPEFCGTSKKDKKTKKLLHFLAKQLDKKERIFEIERIQPSWLSSSPKDKFIFIFYTTTGLTVGLIIGLIGGLYLIYRTPTDYQTNILSLKLITIGLIAGLKTGIVQGITCYLYKNEFTKKLEKQIEKQIQKQLKNIKFLQKWKKENFSINISKFIRGGMLGIIFTLLLTFNLPTQKQLSDYYSALYICCFCSSMIFSFLHKEIKIAKIGKFNYPKILRYSLISTGLGILYVLSRLLLLPQVYREKQTWFPIYELIIFMIVGAIYGGAIMKSDKPITNNNLKEKHNNGIISLGKSAILSFISVLIIVLFISWFIEGDKFPNTIYISLVAGLFASLGVNEGGGVVCIQHFILRIILYWKSFIPWNYTKFLNYTTERILLRKAGNAYLFINDKLLDYFSKLN